MKKLVCPLALALVFAFSSIAAFADIAPFSTPKPVKSETFDSSLTIRLDRDAKEAKLVVPREMVKQFRAALDEADDSSAAAATGGASSTQTIVAGLLISLAIGFGGVLLVRSKLNAGKNAGRAAAVAIVCAAAAATSVVVANIPPPLRASRGITSKLFDKKVFQPSNFASGKIKVEITDAGSEVELRVPEFADNRKNEE